MRNSVKVALAVLSLSIGGTVAAQAQAVSGSGSANVTATVLSAITVTGTDLAFGNVAPTQTKTIAPASGGRFTIQASPASSLSLTWGFPTNLGNAAVTVGSWTALSNTQNNAATAAALSTSGTQSLSTDGTTGALYLWLGGTLQTTSAPVATYTAPVTLSLVYN
jgi:hypothetical protein